jgi:hypothetical protein
VHSPVRHGPGRAWRAGTRCSASRPRFTLPSHVKPDYVIRPLRLRDGASGLSAYSGYGAGVVVWVRLPGGGPGESAGAGGGEGPAGGLLGLVVVAACGSVGAFAGGTLDLSVYVNDQSAERARIAAYPRLGRPQASTAGGPQSRSDCCLSRASAKTGIAEDPSAWRCGRSPPASVRCPV